MRRRDFLLSLGALGVTACASSGTGASRGSPNRITREELEAVETLSAYDAIQRLRPRWLQSRGATSFTSGPSLPHVFLDQSPFGSIEVLRSFQVNDIQSMEFRSAADATTRYGTGYPGGVIEVRTRN